MSDLLVQKPGDRARYHSLDALRAFALLLGVVFHAAESFEPGRFDWAIMDCSPSTTLHVVRYACHSFRLEIFFLMAGFFARLLYERRGLRAFAWNRFNRILIPLVVGWLTLYPLLVFLWLTGAVKSGNWQFLGIPPEARHLAPWQLTLGFFLRGMFVEKFDLTHLWFLHQLLVLYALALGLRALWLRCLPGTRWSQLDEGFQLVIASKWRLWLLAIPTLPMLLLMDGWGVDTPKASLWPHVPTTLLFGFFFACGWLLHRQPALLRVFARSWRSNLAIGLLLVLPARGCLQFAYASGLVEMQYAWVRLAHGLLYTLMMWALVAGFTGLFVQWFDEPSATWRYVADSSYWVYLAHLPLVVALQIWVADSRVHWTFKWPFIVGMALPLLLLSYHLFVRSTFIGVQLNGRKYPFRWPGRS